MSVGYKYKYALRLKPVARMLRSDSTRTENLIWLHVRNRQIAGCKFRRQFQIGNYVLDFYCVEKKLAVELDGGQHTDEKQKIYDQKRTDYLESQGVKVLRFWDNEVWENLDSVLEKIWEEVEER